MAPGLWIWRREHPDWKPGLGWEGMVTSTWVESGGEVALLDALAPPEGAEEIWARLAANSAAHMTEHLFNGVIAVILPLITASLGLNLAQAGALASARTLLAGVASFPSGFFADQARRRNLLLGLCIALIGFASLGLSASSSFPLLLIFMAMVRIVDIRKEL